jgi:hypothetical protein
MPDATYSDVEDLKALFDQLKSGRATSSGG